ncbi:hypothetical protein [Desulfoplanes sp.]
MRTACMGTCSQVMLQTKGSMDEIALFYKKALTRNGLRIEMETKQSGSLNIIFSHGDAGGMVGLMENSPDQIIITIVYSTR